jgi:Na+-transporting methylmalonyl-CoA/oxaloacetate decarboxylase gamma subunit
MKRLPVICVALSCLAVSVAFAAGAGEQAPAQKFVFQPSWSVVTLADANHVPPRKLAAALEIDFAREGGAPLSGLGVDEESARQALSTYRRGEPGLVRVISFIGMSIVFGSLIVVAFLISLLRHLHIFERAPGDKPSARKAARVKRIRPASGADMSNYALAAVVTAIFLHEEEVEAENRMLLTWKRAATNLWKAVKTMPNSAFYNAHRGRR